MGIIHNCNTQQTCIIPTPNPLSSAAYTSTVSEIMLPQTIIKGWDNEYDEQDI
jgi:hypothetical protein